MVIAYLFLFSNLFFLPNKQAPSTVLRNEGRRMTQIQKTGANMQSLKKRGNGAVGVRNVGSFVIYPKEETPRENDNNAPSLVSLHHGSQRQSIVTFLI